MTAHKSAEAIQIVSPPINGVIPIQPRSSTEVQFFVSINKAYRSSPRTII